jgi:hypothetical protein
MTTPVVLTVHATRVEEEAGLLGGDFEFDPFLGSWASWGALRRARCTGGLSTQAPVLANEVELPEPSAVRGDEALWLKQMVHTMPSGVEAIDVANTGHEKRELSAGTARVPLEQLLRAATKGETLTVPLIHTQLHAEFTGRLRALRGGAADALGPLDDGAIATLATVIAYKGQVTLAATFEKVGSHTQAATRVLAALERAKETKGKLFYNSPQMVKAHSDMLTELLDSYVHDYVGDEKRAPVYPLGEEKTLEHLHVPHVVSEFGPMPLGAMAQHRAYDRLFLGKESARFYEPTKDSALFANDQLRSAALRVAMEPAAFVDEVRAHLTQSPTDPTHRPGFVQAVDLIGEMGTFAANRINYTVDQGYPNRAALELVGRITAAEEAVAKRAQVVSAGVAALGAIARHPAIVQLAGALHAQLKHTPYTMLHQALRTSSSGWRARSYRVAGGDTPSTTPSPVQEFEVMDPYPAFGLGHADDCDAMAITAADVVRHLPHLAEVVTREEAPLLHAAADVVRKYYVFIGIASVSGGYVDTNGADLSLEERRKISDLPMIGDDLDKRTKAGGHAIGLLVARAVVADALSRAGIQHPIGTAGDFAAWEKRSPIYILEGTASTDGYVLPIGEIGEAVLPAGGDARALEKAATARKAFLKTLATKADESALLKHSSVEGLSFYAVKQDPRRRISNFYLGVGLLSSPDLAALDPRLGALAVVDVKQKTRGAEMGRFLRMPFDPASAVGFAPVYSRVSKERWEKVVAPVLECIQNQMPLARTDVLESHEEAQVARLRVAQVIPPQVVLAAHGGQLALSEAFDRHAKGLARRLSIAGNFGKPEVEHVLHIAAGSRPQEKKWAISNLRFERVVVKALPIPYLDPTRLYVVYVESNGKYYFGNARETMKEIRRVISVDAAYWEARYGRFCRGENNDCAAPAPLCFYLEPHTVADAEAMRAIFKELDSKKAAGELSHYTITRDRPLLGASDVYTLTAFVSGQK